MQALSWTKVLGFEPKVDIQNMIFQLLGRLWLENLSLKGHVCCWPFHFQAHVRMHFFFSTITTVRFTHLKKGRNICLPFIIKWLFYRMATLTYPNGKAKLDFFNFGVVRS